MNDPGSTEPRSFDHKRFARRTEVTRCQGIKIETTRHEVPHFISAIPIRCTTLTLIHPCTLMTQRQRPNQSPIHSVYPHRYSRILRQLIRNPRLWIERIGIVGEQERLAGGRCRLSTLRRALNINGIPNSRDINIDASEGLEPSQGFCVQNPHQDTRKTESSEPLSPEIRLVA